MIFSLPLESIGHEKMAAQRAKAAIREATAASPTTPSPGATAIDPLSMVGAGAGAGDASCAQTTATDARSRRRRGSLRESFINADSIAPTSAISSNGRAEATQKGARER